jgi:phospholipid-binding lipoprotein MlaA
MAEGNKIMMNRLTIPALLLMLLVGSKAFANEDPWMGFNQKVQGFNDGADRYFLKPAAKGYEAVLPQFARNGVGNFFSNLDDVTNAVNNTLQGKPLAGVSDVGRILINTTLGIGGLFDPASGIGLTKHNESFGQTLAVWGVPKGPYLVLPLLGPSTLTDALSRPVDSRLDPVRYLHPVDHRNRTMALRLLNQRASLLKAEEAIFGDRYIFLRDAYLQRRNYLVNDGKVKDDFGDF